MPERDLLRMAIAGRAMVGSTVGEYRVTELISDKGGFGTIYKEAIVT